MTRIRKVYDNEQKRYMQRMIIVRVHSYLICEINKLNIMLHNAGEESVPNQRLGNDSAHVVPVIMWSLIHGNSEMNLYPCPCIKLAMMGMCV